MTSPNTSRHGSAPIARMSLAVLALTTLIGCDDALNLKAARAEINPLIRPHADAIANGSREDAARTGRDLIATIDCVLDNPECPK